MRQPPDPSGLGTLAGILTHLSDEMHQVQEDLRVVRVKMELLNDWHNRVSGALVVITGLAAGALTLGAVILRFLLERL